MVYSCVYIKNWSHFSLSKMFGVLQLSSALPGSYFGLQDLLSTCLLLQFLIQTFFQLSMPGGSGATSFMESGFASELIRTHRVNPVLSKNFFLASFFSCIGLFLVRSAVRHFKPFKLSKPTPKQDVCLVSKALRIKTCKNRGRYPWAQYTHPKKKRCSWPLTLCHGQKVYQNELIYDNAWPYSTEHGKHCQR